MAYLNRQECCGLREIAGLAGMQPDRALRQLAAEMYGEELVIPAGAKIYKEYGERYYLKDGPWGPFRHYLSEPEEDCRFRYAVFTQAGARSTYGTKFAAYIQENKLGTVVAATTERHRNPNTGRILKAWIWTVDHDAMRVWWKEYQKREKK